MIYWIIGNSEAGKTFLANLLVAGLKKYEDESLISQGIWPVVHLDGDMMREIWRDLKLDKKSRLEQNWRVARLAKRLHAQGFHVVVSTICPYREQREVIEADLKTETSQFRWVHVPGGRRGKEYPFEPPK